MLLSLPAWMLMLELESYMSRSIPDTGAFVCPYLGWHGYRAHHGPQNNKQNNSVQLKNNTVQELHTSIFPLAFFYFKINKQATLQLRVFTAQTLKNVEHFKPQNSYQYQKSHRWNKSNKQYLSGQPTPVIVNKAHCIIIPRSSRYFVQFVCIIK